MNKLEIDKMDKCRHLLPPPGDEVVGQCVEIIRRLYEENEHLKDIIKILRKSTMEE